MDLFLRGEHGSADFRRRLDCIREDSSLPERPVFYVRTEVSARAIGGVLQLGLASIFIRCRAVTLLVIVEAMIRSVKITVASRSFSPGTS